MKALPSVKPGGATSFRKVYRLVLNCETFSKHSAFLFQSYLVVLGIDGTERYRWFEEILEWNHIYQTFPGFNMKTSPWSMILSFQKMLYRSVLRLPKGNMIRKRNMEVFPQ